MPKDATKASTTTTGQFYGGENNKAMSWIGIVMGVLFIVMAIVWSVWAFTSSLWPTSEAWNADCVIWVKVTCLLMFVLPFVNILFGMVTMCCAKSCSANLKACLVLSQQIFSNLASLAKAGWGIYGAFVLSEVESNSLWFTISILAMDLLLLLMVVPYVWGILLCLQQCCCPNRQQKKHAKKYASLG